MTSVAELAEFARVLAANCDPPDQAVIDFYAPPRLRSPLTLLQASAGGQGIYTRIGFVPCGKFREYKPAAAPAPDP